MEDKEKLRKAKKRVKEVKGFYSHLAIYVIVILFLFLINLFTGGGWWFYWVALGWGLAVAIHGVSILVNTGAFGSKWEDKKVKKYMEKEEDEEKTEEK
jgi:hypothetical protein